jgi:hypothetical protein
MLICIAAACCFLVPYLLLVRIYICAKHGRMSDHINLTFPSEAKNWLSYSVPYAPQVMGQDLSEFPSHLAANTNAQLPSTAIL